MMNKRSKLLYVWVAVSAAILIAGIVLFALFGFNTSLDRPAGKTVDVSYNVVVELSEENKNLLSEASEAAFAANGVTYEEKLELEGQADPNSSSQSEFYPTGNDFTLRYVFDADVSSEALANAVTAINEAVDAASLGTGASVAVTTHTLSLQTFNESLWRAAVAVLTGAVVALIYIGVRFGVGCALTGLAAAVNDMLLTLSFFAITRVPVYAFAPWLYAAIAAAASLGLWLVRCMKLRDAAKEPSAGALSAEESVAQVCRDTDKTVWLAAGLTLAVVLVAALCTLPTGAMPVFAAALLPVAAGLYSSMLLAPALHVKVKAKFDAMKKKHVRYEGKKKAKADAEA